MPDLLYKRILLKLSGQSLAQEGGYGLSADACQTMAQNIKELQFLEVQVAVVIGAGNIFRGQMASEAKMQRVPADHIGMIATLINGIALKQALQNLDVRAKVLSAFACHEMVAEYSFEKASKYFNRGEIVIFVGGTGHPYFTTDTAAALRAAEMNCDLLIKATKVSGIYDKDPVQFRDAAHFAQLSYTDILAKDLKVMDPAAVSLCRDNNIPICVVDVFEKGSLTRAVLGEKVGTIVTGK